MSKESVLVATANRLVAVGKGILAADESFPTIGKRFTALGIPPTDENRRAYRELLLSAPGLGESISGVILHDETIRQTTGGLPVPEGLLRQGIISGVKVDSGTEFLGNSTDEKVTIGLEGLPERLSAYRALGAAFTKWRAVIIIGQGLPTRDCLIANARSLALFAALSQEAGLVPIVEPEVLMDGNHTLARCEETTHIVLAEVFAALDEQRVLLEGILLKTGMVLPGSHNPEQADDSAIAEATVRCLRRGVPKSVPGIVFLSGGQGDVAATQRLNAICHLGNVPWKMSFSFGRALQDAAMKTWGGITANASAARTALIHRVRCNALALEGGYTSETENLGEAGQSTVPQAERTAIEVWKNEGDPN